MASSGHDCLRGVAVGVLAGVEQQANNLRMSVLRSQGEGAVARCGQEQTGSIDQKA
jgi:hypothetical protein